MIRPSIASASLIALMPFGLCSQSATAQLKFEVASVKPNNTSTRGGFMDFSNGGERFTMTNMPVGALILLAYDITVRQLSGPAEYLSEKYDVAAKAEYPVKADEMLEMLRTLLADRFKLQLHRESRETPIYALTPAKGGAKLRPSSTTERGVTAFRIPSRAGGTEQSGGHLIFKSESMADFVWALTRMRGIGDRVVVDDTGLAGRYEFDLTFVRDNAPSADRNVQGVTTQPDGPSIFSALQEQLGLKLESRKAPVEFLIIDHIERPSAN
jgi:uncharacterized protein (TIGR03435 family)